MKKLKINAQAYQRLIDIGQALSAEKDIDSLLQRILLEAQRMVDADAGILYLVTADRCLKAAINLTTSDTKPKPLIPLFSEAGEPEMTSLAAGAANLGRTVSNDDFDGELSELPFLKLLRSGDTSGCPSFLAVPLKNHAEETIGVLQLMNKRDDEGVTSYFPEAAKPLVEALASQASVALENRHLLDEQAILRRQLENEVEERTEELKNALVKLSEAHIILKDITTIDAVTGIRNRQFFNDVYDQEWRRAVRQAYPISLMLIDIDHFKKVNDNFGHLAGDECLAVVANSINSLFKRPSDVVARYGGEEFVVILPYIEEQDAEVMADQMRAHIEDLVIEADGQKIGVTISVGIVTAVPNENMSRRELIARADKALYQAKAEGRNRVCAEVI